MKTDLTPETFCKAVEAIAAANPRYVLGHDGADGACDCIGLVRGALRRCGQPVSGLHGTNYAARFSTPELRKLRSAAQLSPGDVVYKVRTPAEKGYSLPARYRTGGSCCTGDLKDYYHIGVVTGVKPLRITHMTTPAAATDTQVGKWRYFGRLKALMGCSGGRGREDSPLRPVTVCSGNGKPVKLRQSKDPASRMYACWEEIPSGTVGTLLEKGETWCRCQFGRKRGYMKSEFLEE